MFLSLAPISAEEVEKYVMLAFLEDEKLIKQYHTSPGDLDHCVANTLNFIRENAAHYGEDMQCFVLKDSDTPVGYTIAIKNNQPPNELYSFGINKKYRTEEIKTAWLKLLEDTLGIPYYIVLWSRNTRAIGFFERHGFEVQRESAYLNDKTKTLIIRHNKN